MTNYIILLPPSEGKQKGGNELKLYKKTSKNLKHNSFKFLEEYRKYILNILINAISKFTIKDLEKIFELKNQKLQDAITNTKNLSEEPTMPAIERYQGVMFKAINYKALTNEQKDNFNSSIIFIDGLFGLLKPQDLIPEYKLKITSKIKTLNITNFWKEKLKTEFENILKNKIAIDILPQTHKKIINLKSAKEIYSIKFCNIKNSTKLTNVGHNSKILKGELINYITKKDNITKKDLENFHHSSGYYYSKEHSKENEIIYLK